MSLSCMGPCTWYVMELGIVTVPVSGFYQQGNIGSCDINHADRVSTKYIDTPFFGSPVKPWVITLTIVQGESSVFISLGSGHEKSPALST